MPDTMICCGGCHSTFHGTPEDALAMFNNHMCHVPTEPVDTAQPPTVALPHDTVLIPKDKPKAAPAPPEKPTEQRTCVVCGKPIPTNRHHLSKTCSDPCAREKAKADYDRWHSKIHPETPAGPIPPPPSAPVPRKTTDEAEVTATMSKQRATFMDPWNCDMCRNAGALCQLHESMERDGKAPPASSQPKRKEVALCPR